MLFVFHNPLRPESASPDLPANIDWDFCQKEVAKAKGFATGGDPNLSKDQQIAQEQVITDVYLWSLQMFIFVIRLCPSPIFHPMIATLRTNIPFFFLFQFWRGFGNLKITFKKCYKTGQKLIRQKFMKSAKIR